jgi:glycosyltransferase involved in cell wall biosynthesis
MAAVTTVVIATYNREQMLRETIASAQRQSAAAAVVVVDDCSSDGTREWLPDHPGVTTVLLERRSERAAARNIGLTRVGTEFVLFLDDDDCLLPTAIQDLERAAKRYPHAAAVVGASKPMPGYEGSRRPLNARRTVAGRWWRELLLGWSPDTAGQILFRTSVVREVGAFDDRYPGIDDFGLLLRLSYGADIVLIPDPVLLYRSHAGQQKQPDSSWDGVVRRQFADTVEPADRSAAQRVLETQDDFFLALASRDRQGRRALLRLVRSAPWLLRSPVLGRLVVRTAAADTARLLLPATAFDRLRRRFGRAVSAHKRDR